MRRTWCALGVLLGGCSGLDGNEQVIALQVQTPPDTALRNLEVSETLQLTATALNQAGNPVAVTISWATPDATLSVSSTGQVIGLAVGAGRVQAQAAGLASDFVNFTVVPRADTLIRVASDTLRVAAGAPLSPTLDVRLESFNPAGGVSDRPIVYQVLDGVAPSLVALPGGVAIDTFFTVAGGVLSPAPTLSRVGATQPDSAIVEISASRPDASLVPGSGQRFVVRFD